MSAVDHAALTELWQQRWPDCDPLGYMLNGPYQDLWVRFHSFPDERRYPHSESEYAAVLERYNTVLDELFAGSDIYVIPAVPTTRPDVPRRQRWRGWPWRQRSKLPTGDYWKSLLVDDDPDPKFRLYFHLFVNRQPWQRGCIDDLLRDVSDGKVATVLITDTPMQTIYVPYDGGADVLLPTSEERDRMRDRHTDWLSTHPSGL